MISDALGDHLPRLVLRCLRCHFGQHDWIAQGLQFQHEILVVDTIQDGDL
jgi:hypothetical protein